MQLWLNRTGEVSLREQLTTQIVLGILCGELVPGQRLPSTRELARRFGIHANTASAAYRQMEHEGWLEFRHGSGVFVRRSRPTTPPSPELAVDRLIGDLVIKTRKLGMSHRLVAARLRRWLALAPPARWLLVEPDPELRRIVLHEMQHALALPISGCPPEDCSKSDLLDAALVTVLPSKAAAVRKLLPAGTEVITLQVHPVGPALGNYLPVPPGVLVGIASRWSEFLRIAQTMLTAAGFPPESLLVRDATRAGWKRGLEATAGVICDLAIEPDLPKRCRPITFRLVADASIAQLREVEAAVAGQPPRSSAPL